MKRMLFGLCTAFLVMLLHAAPAAASNIVWATLAGEACGNSQHDLYMKSRNPEYYNEWVSYLSSDYEVYEYFVSMGSDLYATFMAAASFAC
jgi:hypothetical protein